ncbi:hypothetical protein BFV94_4065 [Alteromonas macleodii]|uniref:Transposase n=1 Tax=Alteromonas macleodii TaxID=28108 RepID=A0AB36FPG3_ALTMA|nr:hypothetical protein BFV95_4074 [Alteromonas macleodii]OES26451.1 hypothetical protein BFV94_4065 [Alteromonas macleodii]OES27174.1 hypothetical protein BFV93_4061 [Alteromonas macleodii]OES39495.1 hypothetical protein BFV96_4055 [Alteromonas macleodii]
MRFHYNQANDLESAYLKGLRKNNKHTVKPLNATLLRV